APWNPVMMKKALAKLFAVSVSPRPNAAMNSYSWPNSNPKPRMIVAIQSMKNRRRWPAARPSEAKWHVTPLDSSTTVLIAGIGHQFTKTSGVLGGGGGAHWMWEP